MGGKSCFFIGHREASKEIYSVLYAAVEQHIVEYGVTEFIVGHYGGFDRLAASAVKEAKRFYPEVRLSLGYRKNRVQTVDYNQNEHSAVHGSTQAVAMIKASSYPALMICINLSVPRRLTARLKLYARKESPVSAATLTFPLVSR